ncbi:MAG TPA: MBL fold metallo-hydrolase [Gemmatimonadales bacterium]
MRGSIPCPGPRTVRYGGNTPCVTLEHPEGDLVILDAGTGIRELGMALRDRGGTVAADLLLSHIHWDHIHGLPFFFPLYTEGTRIRIFGPRHQSGLRSLLGRQMTWEMFPIPASAQVGIEDVVELDGEAFPAGGWEAGAFRLCHPGPTLGYRFTRKGVEPLAYITDNELAGRVHGVTAAWRDDLVDFLQGVHTLVHDATWSDDRLESVAGWGHSTSRQAVELARDAGCRRLVLFHFNPEHDDHTMDRQLTEARSVAQAIAPGLDVVAAIEGHTLALE